MDRFIKFSLDVQLFHVGERIMLSMRVFVLRACACTKRLSRFGWEKAVRKLEKQQRSETRTRLECVRGRIGIAGQIDIWY